jgi:hypothetical protein
MATFTIDLLTGDIYLFSGDFTGSGGTPTSGATYPQVNVYSSLPAPAPSSGKVYLVRNGEGTTVLNRHPAGLYYSTGSVWRYLGDTPQGFLSDNFQVLDSSDTSKSISFETSGITTGTNRVLTIQNSDGTIAYLTDLDSKVDLSAFADYTGTTAPATFLSKTEFNTYTGTTLPVNYYNKTQINAYSASTLLLINAKQDQLVAGEGIVISGTTISVSLPKAIQLVDNVGSVNVNNITATPINWSTVVFSGTGLSFTGGSRIYIVDDGLYGISYVLNINSDSNSDKNIGTVIRKNGNTDITPMSSASFSSNYQNDSSTNIMPENLATMTAGEYIELMAFRIGYAGSVYTVGGGSWIKIEKKL